MRSFRVSATAICPDVPNATPSGLLNCPSPAPLEPNLKAKVPLGWNTWMRSLRVSATAIVPGAAGPGVGVGGGCGGSSTATGCALTRMSAPCESDPGEPGAGSARLAGFPAASATAAPPGESAPAPAYDRPSE